MKKVKIKKGHRASSFTRSEVENILTCDWFLKSRSLDHRNSEHSDAKTSLIDPNTSFIFAKEGLSGNLAINLATRGASY